MSRDKKGRFIKGNIPYCKGKTKKELPQLARTYTEEQRKKVKEKMLGRKTSPKTQFKKGHKIWLGKKHTQKTKEKLSKLRSLNNNPSWKGGISFEPYTIEFNRKLKRQIRKRDNYMCVECGYTQKELGYALSVHHIDYDKTNNSPNNLISLCKSCHSQTNFNRNDWTNYFKEKQNGTI